MTDSTDASTTTGNRPTPDGWTETYRGSVKAWERDLFEHLTVAYYYERLTDGVLTVLEEVGAGPTHIREQRRTLATTGTTAQYEEELRGGDLHHIESAFIGCDERGTVTTGHKLLNSETGAVCAAFIVDLRYMDLDARRGVPLPDDIRERIVARLVEWDRPPPERRPGPRDESVFFDTARDTVKIGEVDLLGHLSVPYYIHRFSDANMHAIARFGLTGAWLRDNRRGFSTFEFQTRFRREFMAGDRTLIRSAIMHIGGSSMRLMHRMYNLRSGEPELAAELSQFGVLLDLDARRPTRIPDELRARAMPLVSEVEETPAAAAG